MPGGYNSAMHIFLILAAVGVGLLVSIQPALNAQLGRSLGHPVYGTLANFSIGLIAASVMVLAFLRPAVPRAEQVASAPWWAWCGGLMGATFVTAALLLVPRLGAVVFIGGMLCGQLLSAAMMDQFAVAGLPHRPLTPTRLAGLALLVAGLFLVQRGSGVAGAAHEPSDLVTSDTEQTQKS